MSNAILFAGTKLPAQHGKLIQNKYLFLLDHLDTTSEIIDALFQEQVINLSEKDRLKSEQSGYHRSEQLLCLLCRKSSEQFEKFLTALENTGQKHVSDELRGGGGASEADASKPSRTTGLQRETPGQ